MNNLIKIEITNEGEQAVSTRELHEKLGINGDYTSWFKYQSQKLGLIEGRDFTPIFMESTGGRPSVDYIVPLDIGKHFCMMSGGEKAYQLREYFIKVERDWNSPEKVMARALQIADRKIHSLESVIEEQRPKAESYDSFIGKENLYSIGVVAKKLAIRGMGELKLFEYLRDHNILCSSNSHRNEPYQEYVTRGYFVLRDGAPWLDKQGGEHINKQCFVTPKGVDFISRMLKKDGYVQGETSSLVQMYV